MSTVLLSGVLCLNIPFSCRFGGYSEHPVVEGMGWLGGCEINLWKNLVSFPFLSLVSGQQTIVPIPKDLLTHPLFDTVPTTNLAPCSKINLFPQPEWSLIVPIWEMHTRQEGSGWQSSRNDQLAIPALLFYHILFKSTSIYRSKPWVYAVKNYLILK